MIIINNYIINDNKLTKIINNSLFLFFTFRMCGIPQRLCFDFSKFWHAELKTFVIIVLGIYKSYSYTIVVDEDTAYEIIIVDAVLQASITKIINYNRSICRISSAKMIIPALLYDYKYNYFEMGYSFLKYKYFLVSRKASISTSNWKLYFNVVT